MRRVLVEHARARRAEKRGGGAVKVSIDAANRASPPQTVIELDDALERLSRQDERPARAIELHYFGGLNYVEIRGGARGLRGHGRSRHAIRPRMVASRARGPRRRVLRQGDASSVPFAPAQGEAASLGRLLGVDREPGSPRERPATMGRALHDELNAADGKSQELLTAAIAEGQWPVTPDSKVSSADASRLASLLLACVPPWVRGTPRASRSGRLGALPFNVLSIRALQATRRGWRCRSKGPLPGSRWAAARRLAGPRRHGYHEA